MPSVDIIESMFETTRGVIDRETQDRALSVIAADAKVSASERELILADDASAFEERVRFRNRFARMCGEPNSKTAAPVGGHLNAIDVQAQAKPSWRGGRLVLSEREGTWPTSAANRYRIPEDLRNIDDGNSVLIPLAPAELHLIELEYQDTRKLRDLEFNYRNAGAFEWKTFRGDRWFEMEDRERAGEIEIEREPDHKAPWVNNPIMVEVELLYPDGHIHDIGTKYLDFHVHDAYDIDSSGYPETDNISNGYEWLPEGELPEGCFLKLTPRHTHRKPWETDRNIAAELSWVQPTYVPEHFARETVFDAPEFEPVRSDGYCVATDRPIAAILVTWTDNGGTSSGSISFEADDDSFHSNETNVGSGETELFPCDGRCSRDGRLYVHGYDVEIRRVEVLYADEVLS